MTEGDKVLWKQAWNFFTIVAAQRLTVVNFYIAIATLLTGANFALLQTGKPAAGLGFLLVALSFIFWKWDTRSRDLIRLAESTLRHFESQIADKPENSDSHMAYLFTHELAFTNERKAAARWSIHHYFTYRICLNLLYGMFSIIGMVLALLSLIS
ncbi:MAG: hypothetical protein L3J03_11570 [Desulfobacterales bacterium]|nr:hypothetical protein [Desulfobacterales bacterium]